MLKKLSILFIVSFLILSSCQTESSSNPAIFFTFQGSDHWQIWKMHRDGTSPEVIYEFPRRLNFLSAQQQKLVSPEIASLLKSEYSPLQDDNLLGADLRDISLSPDKHKLAWVEVLSQCREDTCVVLDAPLQSVIKVFDLDTNTITISYDTTDYLDSPSWSFDSKYIVFGQTPSNKEDTQIILLNVENSESNQLGNGYEPVFVKKKNRIFAYRYSGDHSISCCQFIDLPSKAIEKILVSESEKIDGLKNISFSPNGKNMAAITHNEDLILLDLGTLRDTTFDIPFKSEAEFKNRTEWSSNGKQIAVSTVNPYVLMILDTAGNMQVNLEDVSNWKWSDDGNEVLIMKRNDNGCKTIDPYFYILTLKNGALSKIDLPLSIKNYLSQKAFEMICQIGIGSITW